MNLKKAALLLIIGLFYTFLHKVIIGLFPFLMNSGLTNVILSVLWLTAAFTIILFAYFFLKEIIHVNLQIKLSLVFVIIFTGIILLLKLPFELFTFSQPTKRILFDAASLLNGLSQLTFLILFYKTLKEDIYFLKQSIRLAIWGYGLGLIIGLIGLGYYLKFLTTGLITKPLPFLPIIAGLVTIFTYYAVIIFLIRFRKVEDYKQLK